MTWVGGTPPPPVEVPPDVPLDVFPPEEVVPPDEVDCVKNPFPLLAQMTP